MKGFGYNILYKDMLVASVNIFCGKISHTYMKNFDSKDLKNVLKTREFVQNIYACSFILF